MWVVKLGGSLQDDPLLADWLQLLGDLGGGRVTIVCGGGRFADEVRRVQAHWQFDDLAAHNMALLAMAQLAYLAKGLNPSLQLAASRADIRRVLQTGGTALWLPYEQTRAQPTAQTNWDNSGDSLALELARKLTAERLIVVKSCAIDPRASVAELSDAGVLDARFGALSTGAGFAIDVVERTALGRVRALLLGQPSTAAG